MFDIDKIHTVLEGASHGRACGKTTAMLVTALGYADFPIGENPYCDEPIEIFTEDFRMAEWTLRRFLELAKELGFECIDHFKRFQVVVNHRRYVFNAVSNTKTPPIATVDRKCFIDTFDTYAEIN